MCAEIACSNLSVCAVDGDMGEVRRAACRKGCSSEAATWPLYYCYQACRKRM
jgi:hypothetical protein